MIRFEVPGRCQPKQRARRGKGGTFYTPQPTVDYEKEVAWYAKIAMKGREPFKCPIAAIIEILVVPPPSWSNGKRSIALSGKLTPSGSDVDNMGKSCCDAMNKIIYDDDRQIYKLTVSKRYATQAKAIVTIDVYNHATSSCHS